MHKAVLVYKSLNSLTPDYLSSTPGSRLVDRSSVSNYSLRGHKRQTRYPAQPHTNYMKNSFSAILEQCFGIVCHDSHTQADRACGLSY